MRFSGCESAYNRLCKIYFNFFILWYKTEMGDIYEEKEIKKGRTDKRNKEYEEWGKSKIYNKEE